MNLLMLNQLNNFFFNQMKKLSKVRKVLSKIPDINHGGCGIATLTMYRWLKENNLLDEDTKIIFLYNDDEGRYARNQRAVQKECPQDLTVPTHCALYYKGRIIDSERKISDTDYYHQQIISNSVYLERIIEKANEWNHAFDRKFVSKIAMRTGVELSDIKTS